MDLRSIFPDTSLTKSNESTGSGFESEQKPCFLTVYNKNYTKIHFFQTSTPSCESFELYAHRLRPFLVCYIKGRYADTNKTI